MIIATANAKPITTKPVDESNICRKIGEPLEPNVVSIVVSRVSMETQAAIRLIFFAAEYTGLLYFLYLTKLTIAKVNVVKVYVAREIVVIM